MVGLRFLLFEGCLKQAIAFVFQVLAVFPQPTEHWKFADLQLPVTSIKFKFSCIQDFRKQLVFAFYNFAEVKISKWMDLDSRLKRHCLLTKQLPLSECTYDNIKALQNGTSQLLSSSVCNDSSRIKDQIRSSRQCISLVGVSRESTCVNACPSSSNFDKSHRWFPPFALSFTAAPTFFLGLHLKLLMEHSVTHISFQDHVSSSIECPENSGCLPANDCSIVEDCSNKGSESTPDNNCKASRDVDCNGFLSCSKTVPQEVDISVTSVGDWMKPSLKHHNGGVNVENSAISKDTGKLGTDTVASLQKWPFHHSESEQCHQSPKPLVDHDKSCTGSHSYECPNPTARRSTWHRNRSSSTSFGYLAHGWADGRADFLQNNFGHSQKGLPHKRIRTANEKRSADVSRVSERNLEELSCEANVLITHGDRGWREWGAAWVNKRFTHAMMWKGGKDWILEFPDRSQWARFKEMHEECYNRNIRAASVRNIPIPGVRLIEENDDNGIEVPFVRKAANSSSWEISDEMFEKTMDMFEKAAYSQQCNQFTSDEIEDLMAGLGPMKAIKIIHEYWQQKRQRKGMPLIRHLQPPLWERYQQQLREWELAKRRRLNGFASGDEKAVYQGHNYEPLDDSPLPQISPRVFSPRYASGNGYFSMNSDRYERNHVQKLYRSKSKKPGAFMFPNDTQMVASYNQRMFDKRNGFHQWNIGFSDWPSRRYYHIDGPLCHGPEHFDSSDVDEFRLRDASGAAQHA
ncbi:hypothetical protein GH714_032909 [Hevea brasiliensis]|uniref:Uncharacterized protein n=1 Tax=Hevea brasiliensis TaxID=3981 RepID=A0A6A6LWH5_HEVBR|nr:hypothetical protein GH714_032909 [Hevea brasiliensis]